MSEGHHYAVLAVRYTMAFPHQGEGRLLKGVRSALAEEFKCSKNDPKKLLEETGTEHLAQGYTIRK